MMILGIETSCDDTAAALVEARKGGFHVRKNVIMSQAGLHNKYGGVVPELAARNHLKNIIPVIHEVMGHRGEKQKVASLPHATAVTRGPGPSPSPHVGVETAKTLAYAWGVPLVGVNHMEGHILSVLLDGNAKLRFPSVALIVSGGHTELIFMPTLGIYTLLGKTRDDAAGEAFDKAAFMLGLSYPGGPSVSKRARKGNPDSFAVPRPMIDRNDCEFSFSGMKNAIRLIVEDFKKKRKKLPVNDLAASIQSAIVDILIAKSLIAVARTKPKTFILAGGVAANAQLRSRLAKALPKKIHLLTSSLAYSQDNAAMIAAAGYYYAKSKNFDRYDTLTADANWELV